VIGHCTGSGDKLWRVCRAFMTDTFSSRFLPGPLLKFAFFSSLSLSLSLPPIHLICRSLDDFFLLIYGY